VTIALIIPHSFLLLFLYRLPEPFTEFTPY
jgi:hypothetical protein